MSERILEIEFLLNLSKQIQECRSKEVQNLVQEGVCACVCVCVGEGVGGWLHQSLTATLFLRNIFISMMSGSHIMWNLFTRMIS